jgi:hypothetical protein
MSPLELGDPLAHRALQALLRAEAAVRRRLAAELEREGVSAAGFSALVVLTTAGGSLELTATLEARGLVFRRRAPEDKRSVVVDLSQDGRSIVERLFPAHSDRVTRAFGALDEHEKRSLAELCRKLAA